MSEGPQQRNDVGFEIKSIYQPLTVIVEVQFLFSSVSEMVVIRVNDPTGRVDPSSIENVTLK